MVPNPRISAGSTVGSTGPISALTRVCPNENEERKSGLIGDDSVQHLGVLDNRSHINVANEPRASVTGSHKTVGRDGSICVLDGRSNERSLDETLARATRFE